MARARSGLMAPATSVALPVYGPLRLTVPTREALERARNRVVQSGTDAIGAPLYLVTLARPPAGLICARVSSDEIALRLDDEPEYPDEWPDGLGVAWYERAQWLPCPACGASLVWYEAGYVPGYRVCSRRPYHHVQVSGDGRSARVT